MGYFLLKKFFAQKNIYLLKRFSEKLQGEVEAKQMKKLVIISYKKKYIKVQVSDEMCSELHVGETLLDKILCSHSAHPTQEYQQSLRKRQGNLTSS